MEQTVDPWDVYTSGVPVSCGNQTHADRLAILRQWNLPEEWANYGHITVRPLSPEVWAMQPEAHTSWDNRGSHGHDTRCYAVLANGNVRAVSVCYWHTDVYQGTTSRFYPPIGEQLADDAAYIRAIAVTHNSGLDVLVVPAGSTLPEWLAAQEAAAEKKAAEFKAALDAAMSIVS